MLELFRVPLAGCSQTWMLWVLIPLPLLWFLNWKILPPRLTGSRSVILNYSSMYHPRTHVTLGHLTIRRKHHPHSDTLPPHLPPSILHLLPHAMLHLPNLRNPLSLLLNQWLFPSLWTQPYRKEKSKWVTYCQNLPGQAIY